MIVYHKNNEIDREQWDNCIRNSHSSKPYGYSWYLDIMATGWEALVDDDYDSVFPLPCISRFGIQLISTPPFVQQLGAFSPDKPAIKSLTEFIQYMPDKYRHIDLCVAQKITFDGFKISEKENCELDLSKPFEYLHEGFTPHCKRTLESLQKKNHELTENISPDELLDLHFKNDRKGFHSIKPGDYQRLKNLMNFCIKNKKGRILGVRAGRKKVLSGIFIVETQGRKTIVFSANSPDGVNKKTAYSVVGHLVREYSSSKTTLDFGGSSVAVIDSFMESFGSVKVPYYRISHNSLKWLAGIMK